jgi:hypothetical protein
VECHAPDIIDSDGNRPAVRFGSGGRDGEGYVDGELELRGTIAPEAAWLEVDGTRVDLHGQEVPRSSPASAGLAARVTAIGSVSFAAAD